MSRISRRRLLRTTAALAATGVAAAAVGCGDPDERVAGTPEPSPSPSLTPPSSRGGILRVYNFDASLYDAIDPHLTQFGPIVNVHSAVFSKVMQYADEVSGVIAPDLAESIQHPDDLTYIIKLRSGVAFHNELKHRLAFPKAAGRVLDADDVRYSIERQLSRDTPSSRRFFRQSSWNAIETIDVEDPHTLTIRLKTQVASFESMLADRHAAIIPREVVDRAGDEIFGDLGMIGSGPFFLDAFEPGVVARLRRNAFWFARDDDPLGAGGRRPFLDGYDAYLSPQEDTFQRAAFSRRIVDSTGFVDPAALDLERKTNLDDIVLEETDAGGVLASRFLLDRPPFADDRARRAIHLAIDRQALLALLYPPMDGNPSAKLSGPIPPALNRWAIPDDELRTLPGYRPERAEDIAEAKRLWSAAAGDTAIRELHIFFAGVPKIIPDRAVAAVQRQLQEALGVTVVPQIDASGNAIIGSALGRNLDGATEGIVPFTFGFEDGGVDLDDCLYPHFRSGQPHNTYRLQDPTLDAQLDKQRIEQDEDVRRQIGLDIQDYLLANVNARIEYLTPVDRRLSWGYVRNRHHPIWYGSDYKLADTWLDAAHPSWTGRLKQL